jgi:hypothetical protein
MMRKKAQQQTLEMGGSAAQSFRREEMHCQASDEAIVVKKFL